MFQLPPLLRNYCFLGPSKSKKQAELLKTAAKGKKVRRNDVWEGEDEDWSGDEDDVEENEYKQLGEEATRVEGTRRSSRISSLK